MDFVFVDMGQGDCTLVRTPDQQVFIFDCGSKAYISDASFTLARAKLRTWANGKPVKLVLSHPDEDHYNKAYQLLCEDDGEAMVPVSEIFFSLAKANDSPFGNYTQGDLNLNLNLVGNPKLTEVTINDTKKQTVSWTQAKKNYKEPFAPVPITTEGYELAAGTFTRGTTLVKWDLRILAGGVAAESATWTDVSNTASLISAMTIGKDRVVVTGDATTKTLKFVEANYKARAQSPSILQIPHHGSLTGMPDEACFAMLNPNMIIVSVGLLNSTNFLPRGEIIDKWKVASRLENIAPIDVDFWRPKSAVPGYEEADRTELNKVKDVLWKPYKQSENASGTIYWLDDPKDAGPTKSKTGFFGFGYKGMFIFRNILPKNIWETGIQNQTFQTSLDGK